MNQAEIICTLLIVVAALAILAKKVELPYPVLLVIGGLALGFVPGLPVMELQPDVVFLFLLPPLLYPAAVFTSWRDFRANLRPILLLAIGLVLLTTAFVAIVTHALTGLPWPAAFVLGAIISPPDAVAATAITSRLRVPRMIVTVLDGESLVNDATALVAYRFAIAAMMSGTFSLPEAVGRFLLVAVGGTGIGLAVGWLVAQVQHRLDDPPVQMTISLLTPFAAYIPAERLHLSGVLAVVACRAVSRLARSANPHGPDAAQYLRLLGDDGVPFERSGFCPDRSATAADSSYAFGPLVETADLARRTHQLRRHLHPYRLGVYLDKPPSSGHRRSRSGAGVAGHGDCRLDWYARCGVAGGRAGGANDPFERRPFSRSGLHSVRDVLCDSRHAGASRSEFARTDPSAWSGG